MKCRAGLLLEKKPPGNPSASYSFATETFVLAVWFCLHQTSCPDRSLCAAPFWQSTGLFSWSSGISRTSPTISRMTGTAHGSWTLWRDKCLPTACFPCITTKKLVCICLLLFGAKRQADPPLHPCNPPALFTKPDGLQMAFTTGTPPGFLSGSCQTTPKNRVLGHSVLRRGSSGGLKAPPAPHCQFSEDATIPVAPKA